MYKVEEMNCWEVEDRKIVGSSSNYTFSRPYKVIPNSLCRMYGYGLEIVPW